MILIVRSIMVLMLGYAMSQDFIPFRDPSPHRTQFVSVAPDVQLEVLDWGGRGRPLVFLAGYLTAHSYDDIAPKLTDVAHVYGITRRGLGASSKPHSGYTATQSAEDILRVLDALKLEKPLMVGHSFGGQDLHFLGAKYPGRIGGLVYLASAEDTSLGSLTDHVEQQLDPNKLPEGLRAQSHPDLSSFGAYRDWQRKRFGIALPESDLRQIYAANADGSMGQYLVSKEVRNAMFAGLQAPDYAAIRVPVLALFPVPAKLDDQINRYKPQNAEQGVALGFKYGLDLAWLARNKDALKRSLPGARVIEVPGANVYIFLSNEAEVLGELRAFLIQLGE
jgi:non-heme chloroperoxidase